MKMTDISYFADGSSSTGHSWMHDALKIEIGEENYELFSRSKSQAGGARLSSLGYENGTGPFASCLAKFEADKILKNSKFSEDENLVLFFYEGGAFEFQLCIELAYKMKRGRIWFNFHDSIFWAEACRVPDEFLGFTDCLRDPTVREKVVFSAESEELASMLSKTFDFPCHAFPLYTTLPQQLRDMPVSKIAWESREIDLLVIVGDFEMTTEVSKYVEAAQFALGNDASIHVHWSGRDFETISKLEGLRMAQTCGQISPNEYGLQLANSRFTLLLYPAHRYMHRSSGRIEDAIFFGSVPIVPSKTSLTSQNSRSLPSFESSEDLIQILADFTVPDLVALDAKAFFNEMNRILINQSFRTTDAFNYRGGVGKLRFPSPNKRKRVVDKLSVLRIRLRVPNGIIKAPRSLYRRARQNWRILW